MHSQDNIVDTRLADEPWCDRDVDWIHLPALREAAIRRHRCVGVDELARLSFGEQVRRRWWRKWFKEQGCRLEGGIGD